MTNLVRRFGLTMAVLVPVFAGADRAEAGLVGISSTGRLFDIDTATGLATNPRQTNGGFANGIAARASAHFHNDLANYSALRPPDRLATPDIVS